MKRFFCALAATAALTFAVVPFAACTGSAEVTFSLSEDGTHYIVSGVSGSKRALKEYEIPAVYAAEEGEALLPVTEIGAEAFMSCTALSSVVLPESVTKIDTRAFMGSGLTRVVLPESVEYIGYAAFGMCSSLTEITVPQSVTYLGEFAFAYCSNLVTADVRANVEDLLSCTFANPYKPIGGNVFTSTSLTTVYLPATLKKISADALDGNLLEDIYFYGTQEQWDDLYFYETVLKEGSDSEYEQKRLEKSDVLSSATRIRCGIDVPPRTE